MSDWKRRLGVRPNNLTRLAVHHPVAYSLGTGVLVVLLAAGSLASIGTGAVVAGAAVGGLGITVLNLVLWRPGGPGRRWYERSQSP